MLTFLRRKAWLKGAVGIFAAYVLALQMVLAGIVATQMAAAEITGGTVICHSNTSDSGDGQGPAHIQHASCAVCTLASSSSPIPETAAFALPVSSAASTSAFAAPAFRIAGRRHNPRSSQGPPQTA